MLLVPWVQQMMSFFPFESSLGIYSSAGNSSPAVSARCSGIRLSTGTAIAPRMAPWDISTSSLMSTIRYESLSSSCISSIVISNIFSALLPILSMPYLYHHLIFVIKCSVITLYARLCGCFYCSTPYHPSSMYRACTSQLRTPQAYRQVC